MYKTVFWLLFFYNAIVFSQNNTTVKYTPNTGVIANPERGFYKHFETTAANYVPLETNELMEDRLNTNTTLILRLFYLEKFLKTPISDAYLAAIKTDFDAIRNAGIKCIVRFAYSKKTNGVTDATKHQILKHITQLKPILTENADIISVLQAGFIGTWGEWFYTTNFGKTPTEVDYANRKEVTDALLAAIPMNRMIQVRTPLLKQKMYKTTLPVAQQQAFKSSALARIGHFNDCFLASETDKGTYTNPATEYPYLEAETQFVPMGGETCDLDAIRTNCTNAISEMDRFHWSFLNYDYHPDVIANFKKNACFDEMNTKLGYRFALTAANFPDSLSIADPFNFRITLMNTGFACSFSKKQVAIVLRNTTDETLYTIKLDTDVRFWNKNKSTTLSYTLNLPKNMLSGKYALLLHIADEDSQLKDRPEYAIQLANLNTWEPQTGYNNLLHTITIQNNNSDTLPLYNTEINPNIVINPIPANQELTIELPEIATYIIKFYNTIGEIVPMDSTLKSDNISIVNTKNVSEGVYLIELQKDQQKYFKKITIKH